MSTEIPQGDQVGIERISPVTSEEKQKSLKEYIDGRKHFLRALRAAAQLQAIGSQEALMQRREILDQIKKDSAGEFNVLSGVLIQFGEWFSELYHGKDFDVNEGHVKGFIVRLGRYELGTDVVILDEGLSRINYDKADQNMRKIYASSIGAAIPHYSLAFVSDRKGEFMIEDYFMGS